MQLGSVRSEEQASVAGPASESSAKLARLEHGLRQLGTLLVAYSGGVDSAFLAATAYRVLGDRMLAVIADSASLARHDLIAAQEFAKEIGFPLRLVATAEVSNADYQRNDANRCFHCKDELFRSMETIALELGFKQIAYGLNLDDNTDYRPGQRAATEHGILAPLAEAGMTKSDIRALAKAADFSLWDRPATPCLSSRVEYGRSISPEILLQVERAEASLRDLGYRIFRVRHHGELARVEIAGSELPNALTASAMKAIDTVVSAAGFRYVTLDCAGFRSGSMNAILPVEVLQKRGA